jgi:hypothetical protein
LALVLGNGPVRFGAEAKTALIAEGSQVKRVDVKPGDFTPLETLFAYPLARLSDAARGRASVIEGDADKLRALWTLGLAAELVGAMDSTIQWTLDYVIQRKQFGRAIGSFQAVHHRLAECAVLRESARWLTLKAGGSGDPADAALASGFAQDAAKRVAYDAHQFHGAIGLTLEHPLHLWTYRLKALISELGGASAQFDAAAQAVWGA